MEDNQCTIALSNDASLNERTKHNAVRYNAMKDLKGIFKAVQ